MKLEKNTLPDFLLADLFKTNLVLIDNEIEPRRKNNTNVKGGSADEMILVSEKLEKPADIPLHNKPFSYLGNNHQHISIIVNDPSCIHLDDAMLQILSAILTACKLNLADVAIINTHHQQVTDAIIRKELQPAVVLLFGVETTAIDLPFSIPEYKVQPFNNCSYVQSAPLQKMAGTTTDARMEKSKLWLCLKDLFKI